MTLKGRSTRGSKNATSKLKDDDIPKIRQLISLGVTLTRIAKDFGVSVSTICEISKGKRWRHIR
jgi:DNA invertase Pin-like site-specific DNA recombinase